MANRPRGPLEGHGRGEYFGIYIGYIRDVDDPEKRGRIRCFCPNIMGEADNKDHWLDWAMPNFLWAVNAGTGKPGAAGYIPAAGGPDQDEWGVHIQFIQGDVRYPVWLGVFPLEELNQDELAWEATKRFTAVVGDRVFEIDEDAATITITNASGGKITLTSSQVQLAGATYPLPKFSTFESALATALNALATGLALGTAGSPVMQQLVGLAAIQTALQTLITQLNSGTFESTKVRND